MKNAKEIEKNDLFFLNNMFFVFRKIDLFIFKNEKLVSEFVFVFVLFLVMLKFSIFLSVPFLFVLVLILFKFWKKRRCFCEL